MPRRRVRGHAWDEDDPHVVVQAGAWRCHWDDRFTHGIIVYVHVVVGEGSTRGGGLGRRRPRARVREVFVVLVAALSSSLTVLCRQVCAAGVVLAEPPGHKLPRAAQRGWIGLERVLVGLLGALPWARVANDV